MINKVIYNNKNKNFEIIGYMSNEAKEILKELNISKNKKLKKKRNSKFKK